MFSLFKSLSFYHRAVLVVAWDLKAGRWFPIPVVTGSMQTRDNPGPRQPPHLPDSPKDSETNSSQWDVWFLSAQIFYLFHKSLSCL